MSYRRCFLLCVWFWAGFLATPALPQASPPSATARAEVQDESMQLHIGPLMIDFGPPVVILFGAFCALWAQNTGRNCWLWFFLGLLFSIVTIFVLLIKNANDLQRRKIRDRVGAPDKT